MSFHALCSVLIWLSSHALKLFSQPKISFPPNFCTHNQVPLVRATALGNHPSCGLLPGPLLEPSCISNCVTLFHHPAAQRARWSWATLASSTGPTYHSMFSVAAENNEYNPHRPLKWRCRATPSALSPAELIKGPCDSEIPQNVIWKLKCHGSWTTLLLRLFLIESASACVSASFCLRVFHSCCPHSFPLAGARPSGSCCPSLWVKGSCL